MISLLCKGKDYLSKNAKWLILCFGSVFIFGFLANAFGMFSPSFLNDTLTLNMVADGNIQYGIGRFFQPLYRRMTISFSNTFIINFSL